jgi:hypothetical protein
MSFLDSLKQDALAVLHATANALHAQLANTLAQAGHAVSEADHVDTLVAAARAAATGAASAVQASTTAPNYADAALATFSQSMTTALVQFAQQHLPAKFQGVAADATQVVIDAAGAKPQAETLIDDGLKFAAAAVTATVPGTSPIAMVAEPIVEEVLDAVIPRTPAPVVEAHVDEIDPRAPAFMTEPAVGAMNKNGV